MNKSSFYLTGKPANGQRAQPFLDNFNKKTPGSFSRGFINKKPRVAVMSTRGD
jgi:hypothetical protein